MNETPRTTFRQRFFARLMAGEDDRSQEMYRARKERLLCGLRGRVLEIGPGTGVNLPFLDREVEWIGLEPNPAMHRHVREKAEALGLRIDLRDRILTEAGIEEESMDAVISTLVLCSVPDLPRLLNQIRAVLKPGGRFVFLEHVVDGRGTFRRLVQKSMPYTPWRYFSDGCDPGRDIGGQIRGAGFSRVTIEDYRQEGPGIILAINRPHIAGVAVK